VFEIILHNEIPEALTSVLLQ